MANDGYEVIEIPSDESVDDLNGEENAGENQVGSEVFPRISYSDAYREVIDMLCRLPEEISDEGLEQAFASVLYMAEGGFKVNWLVKALDEVKDKKKKSMNQEGDQKYSEVEKGKSASVALSFDDIVSQK